ncbi:MAG: AzlD domain-containing protein, partial [Saccharofermentans sp.]|nr:AzlD domain-containing protein [Saccharofermentans sp.]
GREVPKSITYLGKVLPMSVMTILVVYCVKGVRFDSPDNFVPTLVGLIVTALLHLWKKNTFLSIVAGTVIYMLMVQLVF